MPHAWLRVCLVAAVWLQGCEVSGVLADFSCGQDCDGGMDAHQLPIGDPQYADPIDPAGFEEFARGIEGLWHGVRVGPENRFLAQFEMRFTAGSEPSAGRFTMDCRDALITCSPLGPLGEAPGGYTLSYVSHDGRAQGRFTWELPYDNAVFEVEFRDMRLLRSRGEAVLTFVLVPTIADLQSWTGSNQIILGAGAWDAGGDAGGEVDAGGELDASLELDAGLELDAAAVEEAGIDNGASDASRDGASP